MTAYIITDGFPNVTEHWAANALIDTSAIGTDTISAATLYWYHVGYTTNTTYSRIIKVGVDTILNSTATPAAAGWHSEALTSGELAQINKTGSTLVEFDVGTPGKNKYRTWEIRTWDYSGNAHGAYIAVTHAPAGGPTKFSILR